MICFIKTVIQLCFKKGFKGFKICIVVRQHGFYPNNKYSGWIVEKKKTRKRNSQYIFWFSYFGTYPTTINTQSILNTVIIKYEWKQVNLTKVYRKESCRKMCTNNNISCIKTFIDKEMITYFKNTAAYMFLVDIRQIKSHGIRIILQTQRIDDGLIS